MLSAEAEGLFIVNTCKKLYLGTVSFDLSIKADTAYQKCLSFCEFINFMYQTYSKKRRHIT